MSYACAALTSLILPKNWSIHSTASFENWFVAGVSPLLIPRKNRSAGRLLFGGHNFYPAFARLMVELRMEGHPHMLRHSRASHMLHDGEDIYKVARLLGDTVATVERVYGHSQVEFLKTDSGV